MFALNSKNEVPASSILSQSTLIENGKLSIYRLPAVLTCRKESFSKYQIGIPSSCKREKVLLLLGSSGAGISTMIDGLANYLMGVEFKDPFRFKVVMDEGSSNQAHSQTRTITAYTFHGTILDYTLTVIDTPGFGNTGGIEKDMELTRQIEKFFSEQHSEGINVVHGIGFVMQAPLARLTPQQNYVFNAVLSIFGKDIVESIFLLATFADASIPQVIDSAKEACIPYQQWFKFNHSALYATTDSDRSSFISLFWKMGAECFSQFFAHFSKMEAKNFTLTKEVLTERQQLQVLTAGLLVCVKVGLNKMEEIRQEEMALAEHARRVSENENFEYNISVQKIRQIHLPIGTNTTTCRDCNYTCHNDCPFPDDRSKANCTVMSGGYCTVCPNRCHWAHHSNVPYRMDYYTETVTKTYEAKKEMYVQAKSGKEQVERSLAVKQKELEGQQTEVYKLIEVVQKKNGRLQEIALMPNPLSNNYLELLILSEESEMKQGWKDRVAQYRTSLKEAQCLKIACRIQCNGEKSVWTSFVPSNC